MIKPSGKGSKSKAVEKIKDPKKSIGSYGRLIANTKNLDTDRFSPPVSISIKDSFGRLFSRESSEVTLMKKKLSRYGSALQNEVVLAQKSVIIHSQHMTDLAINLKEQELQLKRWALGHLFRTFQLQAWLRHSRSKFVIFLVKYILNSLEERVEDVNNILRNILNSGGNRAQGTSQLPLYSVANIEKYCVAPEPYLLSDPLFVDANNRLLLLDKLCHRSLHKFKTKLPELESKSQADRMDALHVLLMKYSNHLKNSQPLVKGKNRLTWDNFIIWSMKRQNEQTDLEKEYMSFVEDERETEGRLFRRWCILMNPKFVENELNILTVPVHVPMDQERVSIVQQESLKNSFNGDAMFVNSELSALLAATSENMARSSTASKAAPMTPPPGQKPGN